MSDYWTEPERLDLPRKTPKVAWAWFFLGMTMLAITCVFLGALIYQRSWLALPISLGVLVVTAQAVNMFRLLRR